MAVYDNDETSVVTRYYFCGCEEYLHSIYYTYKSLGLRDLKHKTLSARKFILYARISEIMLSFA